MIDDIDKQIAGLEKQLAGLRRQKLAALQSQVAELEASLGSEESTERRGKKGGAGRGRKKGWAAVVSTVQGAMSGTRRKRRGRKRGKHISDPEAVAMLSKAVSAAGSGGISARQASVSAGVFYPRAIALMDKNFKKRGSGKWTRYTAK